MSFDAYRQQNKRDFKRRQTARYKHRQEVARAEAALERKQGSVRYRLREALLVLLSEHREAGMLPTRGDWESEVT